MAMLASDALLDRIDRMPAFGAVRAAADEVDARVYLVGGAVRDLLVGANVVDIDICVDGPIGPLVKRLGGGAPRGSGSRFGTATVIRHGVRYDIARTRRESYPCPGALPEVEPADIGADLRRRDFTINAIAVALNGAGAGTLTAVPDALDDLRRGRLRVLHDRSFVDDPTRLLRLARYAARLQLTIDEHTRRLVADAVAGDALATVSGARLGNELRLLATEADPIEACAMLTTLGLAPAIGPCFGLSASRAQIATEALALLPPGGRRDLLVMAACWLDAPDRGLAQRLDELALTAADRSTIVAAATRARALAGRLAATDRPSQIAAAIGSAPPELVALAGALGAPKQADAWLQRLSRLRLQITGEDLIAAGIPEGPAIGAALNAARVALLDGEADDHASQLRVALDSL